MSYIQADRDTLANFRKRFLPELEDLFVQVLSLAQTMKLLQLGQIRAGLRHETRRRHLEGEVHGGGPRHGWRGFAGFPRCSNPAYVPSPLPPGEG
jgi:hypothetical protein